MTQQRGNYGSGQDNGKEPEKDLSEQAKEIGEQALDRADEWLKPIGLSIKERPMTCLAVVGGLAFVGGAVWMMRSSRNQSQLNDILGQLSDVSRRARFW